MQPFWLVYQYGCKCGRRLWVPITSCRCRECVWHVVTLPGRVFQLEPVLTVIRSSPKLFESAGSNEDSEFDSTGSGWKGVRSQVRRGARASFRFAGRRLMIEPRDCPGLTPLTTRHVVFGTHRDSWPIPSCATTLAIGLNPKVYFKDALLRISSESDAAKLTPHGWKDHLLNR